jgi:hypothetical protein
MLPDWLSDLMLDSPVPPPNWLPNRAGRLADARLSLQRRFGSARPSRRPGHTMTDLGRPYALFPSSRTIPGETIEADLEAAITTVNPPVLQGWMVATLTLVLAADVVALIALKHDGPLAGLAWLIEPAAAWFLVVAVVAHFERVVELDEEGVRVRRWTEVWLRRPGIRLGDPRSVVAALPSHRRLVIRGERGWVGFWTTLWPHSAHLDLRDELPLWGARVDVGPGDRHQRRHPDRG